MSRPVAALSESFVTKETLVRAKSEMDVADVDREFNKPLVADLAVVSVVVLGGG